MGSCASSHRKSGSSGKFHASLVNSQTDKNPNSMPCTPVKNQNLSNVLVVDQPIGSQFSFSNSGSKEEAFFDSQLWLESDCDDDFCTVNGDFTPSRGSTPLHSASASPQVNRAVFQGRSAAVDEPSRTTGFSTPQQQVETTCIDSQEHANTSPPTEKKKKLADLFRDSTRKDQHDEFSNESEAKSGNATSTPFMSGTNSQCSSAKRTPMDETRPSDKSALCCFPRLTSARGLKKTFFVAPPIAVDA